MVGQILTAARVEEVFLDCLFRDGEPTETHIEAHGIVTRVGFHPGRLDQHKAEIVSMLNELPDSFKQSGGQGMSFLEACNDRHGVLWTGLHRSMEQLFLLGMATGKVKCLLPREMWSSLPGGVPYYVVMD